MDETEKLRNLFEEVGRHYRKNGAAEADIYQNNGEVHAFYRLTGDNSQVIHVQGDLGLSDKKQAHVHARLMDYKKMMEIRQSGKVSVGKEHGATIQAFINFECGVRIPYSTEVLEEMLAENISQLKNP